VVKGPTTIGANNRIFQFGSIGEDTADMKYKGETTRLEIGDNNIIREGVTLHRGTVQDRGVTTIGSDNLIMAYVHVGHDSIIGDHCILVNNTALAGHVHIGDWAILSGYTLVHQYVHIGAHSFTGMGTTVGKDIPAYLMVNGNPGVARGINTEGLQRRDFSAEAVAAIRNAYKIVYRKGLILEDAITELETLAAVHPEVKVFQDSLRSSNRGIIR
jgi:UDP-N-acetylglucosamine acyltransferase